MKWRPQHREPSSSRGSGTYDPGSPDVVVVWVAVAKGLGSHPFSCGAPKTLAPLLGQGWCP